MLALRVNCAVSERVEITGHADDCKEFASGTFSSEVLSLRNRNVETMALSSHSLLMRLLGTVVLSFSIA
jgi:hypothetical protein